MKLILGLIFSISICLNVIRTHPNLKMIEEINKLQTTWVSGENTKFTNKDINQIKMLLGSLKNPKKSKLRKKIALNSSDLPVNYDLREVFPKCESIKEVRDQSNCGSCWAFGAVEAMSDRICIASGQTLQTRISSEDLLSCCTECGSCNGGFTDEAWSYFGFEGLVTGGLYEQNDTCLPYKFKPCDHHVVGKYGPCDSDLYPTPKCENKCNSDYKKTQFKDDKWYASDVYLIEGNELAMMNEIYNHGSIEVSFTVYEDFVTYKSGVYQHVQGQQLGGHAVKAIGWGVENGVNYWLIVNSWNEGWGDNGLFKILRGSDHCGIESDPVAGIPKLH